MKPNLLSGIQPSGQLHIGNYLGALKNFVDLQNNDQHTCYFFVADLHSLTEDFEPTKKIEQILDLLASYLAAGLDPKKSVIFIQSHVPAHTGLAWILNTITPFGEMSRMTQFKDKSEVQKENGTVGLFAYPVLMAADIILYDTQFVPVGDDQLQHLEFTRALARKFNNKFGATFIEPQPLLTQTPRIMDLQDPTKKMSKSQPSGCLFLDDTAEDVQVKIMNAVTDSETKVQFNPQDKAGVSNLMMIYAALSQNPEPDIHLTWVEEKFRNKNYAFFKKNLTKLIIRHCAPFRRKKIKLLAKPERLLKIAARGAKTANKIAQEKIMTVTERLGLLSIFSNRPRSNRPRL